MMRTRWISLGCLAAVAGLGLMSCKKKSAEEEGGAQGVIPKLGDVTPGQINMASKLGFAAHLPADTEAYLGTLNLKKHLTALKTSNWAKDVDAFLEDKTPAPTSGKASPLPEANAVLASLWGQDGFIALGKGAAAALKPWQKLSSIQTELQYLSLMQGTTGGANIGEAKEDRPAQMIRQLLGNTELLQQAADIIATLSLPPVMLGVRTDKPDEVLKQLVPESFLAQAKEKAKVSQMTGASGKFTLIEGTMAVLLTDETKKALIAGIPADQTAAVDLVTKALTEVQAKPFCLSYGTAHGHLIVALGAQRPNLDFNADAASSLLARPELGFLSSYADRNLAAVTFVEAAVLEAMRNPEPLQPIARGLVGGLKSSPVFGPMAAALEPKVKSLGDLERQVHSRALTSTVGAAWWEGGLRIELKGGLSPEGLQAKKPLRFGPLMDDPSVLFGIAYHGDPSQSAKIRALIEAWVELLHSSAQELVKAGLGGKDGPEIAKWVEADVIPPLLGVYNSSKVLYQEGTGDEHAWVIDMGGKAPPLPLLPQKPGEAATKMVRIAAVDEVVNRGLVGKNWSDMEQSLNQALAAFPMLQMKELPPSELSNAPGGLSTYAYPLLPESDDLVPVASISDSMLIMGTSKPQHAELATRLLKAKPVNEATTLRWRVSFPAIREAVTTFAVGSAADSLRPAMKWMGPLGEAGGRIWVEAGNVRQSITVNVKDTVKYD